MIKIEEQKDFRQLLKTVITRKEPIFVVLKSGKEYFGKIGKMDHGFFSIKKISGREYYDAMVSLDAVAALEVRNVED